MHGRRTLSAIRCPAVRQEAKKHLLDISYWDQMLTVQGGPKKAASQKSESAEEQMIEASPVLVQMWIGRTQS